MLQDETNVKLNENQGAGVVTMRANRKLIPLAHSCQIGDFCVQLMPPKKNWALFGDKNGEIFLGVFFWGTRNFGDKYEDF